MAITLFQQFFKKKKKKKKKKNTHPNWGFAIIPDIFFVEFDTVAAVAKHREA